MNIGLDVASWQRIFVGILSLAGTLAIFFFDSQEQEIGTQTDAAPEVSSDHILRVVDNNVVNDLDFLHPTFPRLRWISRRFSN